VGIFTGAPPRHIPGDGRLNSAWGTVTNRLGIMKTCRCGKKGKVVIHQQTADSGDTQCDAGAVFNR